MTFGRAIGALAILSGGIFLPGCEEGPPLPGGDRDSRAPAPAAVSGPVVPGESEEFREMEVPPGQITRAIPIGEAVSPESGPVYRSLCLSCHSVSQTSFGVQDWQESLHARAGVSCSSCHGAHEGPFIPQPGPDRC